jgi:hypothetical protein
MPEEHASNAVMTDALAEIKARLARYPSVRYTETPTSIEVAPDNDEGFPVSQPNRHGTEAVPAYS